MRLNEKKVLITAAGQGIGRAAALACAAEGAQVIATDINETALVELKSENGDIEIHRFDVTNSAETDALAQAFGPLDGLFNCAGIVHHGTILDVSDDDWARSMNVNVSSMIRTCRAFIPGMVSRAETTGTAAILNMSSMCSSIKGFVNRAAYGATKAAVIGLTKAIAADFVTTGLRCNAICPGTVDTPSLRGRIADAPDPVQAEKDFIARQPMGRLAEVGDLTPTIVHLLSDDSRFISGQAITVDGGVTI